MIRGGDEDGERDEADAETNRRDGDSSVVPNLYRREEELLPLPDPALELAASTSVKLEKARSWLRTRLA